MTAPQTPCPSPHSESAATQQPVIEPGIAAPLADAQLADVTNQPGHHVTLSSPMATPELDEAIEVDVATSENLPWMCIVWDDPVNLMSYVSYVFQTVLGYDKKRANELMMQVHTEGKAAVSTGERDKIEADVKKLHVAGLWATMQQAG